MFATRVLSAAAFFVGLASAISLDAPAEWKQCERVQLVGKGKGSLNLAILPEDDECGDAVKEWLNVESATFNYTVPQTMEVGQKFLVLLEENDSDAEEWSKPITIVAGECDGAAAGTTPGTATATNNFLPPTNTNSGTNPTGTSSGGSITGNGGAANVGSVPGSTDKTDGAVSRSGVSAMAVVVGAVVFAMAL